MIRLFKNVLLIGLIFLSSTLMAQGPSHTSSTNAPKGNSNKPSSTIRGIVIDESTGQAIPYVNIAIIKATKDSTLVNGITTDNDGHFVIKQSYGKYIIRLSFIGYKNYITNLNVDKDNINLGTIKIKQAAETLQGVEITAERSMVEYQLDKRVVNVDKNLVSAGGSASDVLESVPSVAVDQDGNVSLRGSGGVKILVDGRPSELLGSDLPTILAQIPASTIESIEIITNPSAKYNPEGMSGIINIKLKEKGNRGFNGNVALSGGFGVNKDKNDDNVLMPQTSFSMGLNYSTKKYAIYANGDLRYHKDGSSSFSDKSSYFPTDTVNVLQNRYTEDSRMGGGFKIGGDWYINNKNTLTLSYNLRRGGTAPNSQNTEDLFSKDAEDSSNPLNKNNYYGLELSTRRMFFQNFALSYEKKFDQKDRLLTLDANWNIGTFSSNNTQTRSFDINSVESYYLRTESKSDNDRAVVTLNYTHPFTSDIKLEIGYNLNYVNTNANFNYYNTRADNKDDSMSYTFHYKEQVHAIYATLGYSLNKKLSAQLGIRAEEVIREGNKVQNNEKLTFPKDKDTKNYFSLYPTVHLSYNITESQSTQISYSRRIRRPDPWALAPYIDINNPANIRFGNPDILPEYTDAFEIGYNKIFETTSIFASLYYRQTNNAITNIDFLWNQANATKYGFEWVWAVAGVEYSDGMRVAMTSKNLAKSSNYGAELILDQKITKWWKVNLSGNLFGNYADGREFGGKLVKSINWDAKLNSTMTLPKSWVVQISAQYNPERQTIQGYSTQMYWADIAIKKDILNKKGSLSLRFSDVFNTRQRTTYTFTENYKQYSTRQRTSQVLVLSFNYRFGVMDRELMKRQKKGQQENSGIEIGGEE